MRIIIVVLNKYSKHSRGGPGFGSSVRGDHRQSVLGGGLPVQLGGQAKSARVGVDPERRPDDFLIFIYTILNLKERTLVKRPRS